MASPRVRRLSVGSVLVLVLLPTAALAQHPPAPPRDPAAAERLFQEGRSLLVSGDYAKACEKFAESQRLDPGVGTLLNLADCWERTGKIASAWATFGEAETAAKSANEGTRAEVAKQRKDALEPHLPRLTISVPPATIVAGLVVRRDGTEVTKASWGLALPVDPGEHVVEATAPGKKPSTQRISVGRDQKQTITIEPLGANGEAAVAAIPPVVAQPPAPAPPPQPPEAAPDESRGSGQRAIGVILAGVGLVGLGVGAVYGLTAKSTYDDSAPFCDANGFCTPTGVSRRDQAMRDATVSTVAFGVGAAALVGGVTLWLTAPKPDTPATAFRVGPTPGGAAMRMEASW